MNDKIKASMSLDGSDTPAYKALLDVVFDHTNKETSITLRSAWTDHLRKLSDDAHNAVQKL